jgi:hypothetical protein
MYKEMCGAPEVKHERTRLGYRRLLLALGAEGTRTVQERLPDSLLRTVAARGKHAVLCGELGDLRREYVVHGSG